MSLKCTILNGDRYHLYWDYTDNDYHLYYEDEKALKEVVRRVGRLLESCPFSDSGIYFINLKTGKADKLKSKKVFCPWIENGKKDITERRIRERKL